MFLVVFLGPRRCWAYDLNQNSLPNLVPGLTLHCVERAQAPPGDSRFEQPSPETPRSQGDAGQSRNQGSSGHLHSRHMSESTAWVPTSFVAPVQEVDYTGDALSTPMDMGLAHKVGSNGCGGVDGRYLGRVFNGARSSWRLIMLIYLS